jgi:hypothetical protein
MRLLLALTLALCVPALALADGSPHPRTLVGTLAANPSGSVTVNSTTASLTCAVPGNVIESVAKLQIGLRVKIACRPTSGALTLVSLARVASRAKGDGAPGSGDAKDPGASAPPATTTTTEPTHPTEPTEPSGEHRDARGKVTALGSGSITVTRGNGSSVTCSLTDGQLHSISQLFHVGSSIYIVCTADGALLSAAPGDSSTPAPPTQTEPTTATPAPAPPAQRDVHGVVTHLSSDGVAVLPDAGGDALTCAITQASDSAAAAAKLSLGAHVAIVCGLDGSHYVLSGATLIP